MSVAFHTGSEPIPGYRLLDRLGSGGFGEVWRCEAPGGIFKAVKVIHGDLRQKDTDAYRFAEQELKSLKRVKQVRHPYLVALDRFDIVDGRLVIVMEMADCNLWDRFRECREQGRVGIPRDELLRYMQEAAEVLDLMNDKYQLQHLDIKPQNLFLLFNHVKVADFGQVKDLERHVAQVTGGITPVYAAPETFDGFVSRYCDQYSLACVYQELLTGVRPFDGTSMNQLLMQHLSHAPNLEPSPPADRPALARALSKKPEDRFHTVSELVEAIRTGAAQRVTARVEQFAAVGAPAGVGVGDGSGVVESYPPPSDLPLGGSGEVFAPPSTPYPRAIPLPPVLAERVAPPERSGPGELRPALVIGVGYAGRRALQRLHRLLAEECGSPRRLPHVRTLYIDTDPEAATACGVSAEPGFAPLPADCLLHTPLNRAAHYLRPRNNGRAVIEGWFDAGILYRMSRVPTTGGVRALGRLAACDHHRLIAQRIQAELDAILAPDHLEAAAAVTRRQVRTNRPRVYVVAGLGGGTGGGMAIDLAYTARQQLRRIGYSDPDVVGVLLVPPADGSVSQQARANTYAALTELHHFGHPETAFVAGVDEGGLIRDNDPPFTRTLVLKGYDHPPDVPSGTQTQFPRQRASLSATVSLRGVTRTPIVAVGVPARPEPAGAAAEFLRLDLLTPLGRAADDWRAAGGEPGPAVVAAAGSERFTWPRHAVVVRAVRVIGPVLLGHWLTTDPAHLAGTVPRWAAERWEALGLNPDTARRRLRRAADAALGEEVSAVLRRTFDPLVPKGWMAKLPEPPQVAAAVDRTLALFGPPRETPGRGPGPVAQAVAAEAKRLADEAVEQLADLLPALLDTQGFRLAGAEEVARRLLLAAEQQQNAVRPLVAPAEGQATAAYDRLLHYTAAHKGVRKPTAAELADALRQYPENWYEAVVNKHLADVYARLVEAVVARLGDLGACRKRLEEYHARLVAEADVPPPPTDPDLLLPAGCETVEQTAQRFLGSLDDEDLSQLEQRFQKRVSDELGGLYEGCVNSADGPEAMPRLLRDTARDYLTERLGAVDLAGMMRHKFGPPSAVAAALDKAFAAAQPSAVGRGPWAKDEVCVFAAPAGAGGEPVAQLAVPLLPPTAVTTHTPDEVVIYREWPRVPLSALDQLGPAWEAAYRAAPDTTQTSPHTRTDITCWLPVDG